MANTDETKSANGATELNETNVVSKEVSETNALPKEEGETKEEIVLTKELENQINKQIEYYFGDYNLPRDKFLQEQIGLDEGWVPLTVLLKFNRMKKICNDLETIAKSLINSENNLVIVSDDKTKIRRNPEMPIPEYNEERRKELTSRTAYVKGFPQEETLESLMKFMANYGQFESIYRRTYKDKILKSQIFKGSIFVIFKDVETCKKFIEAEDIKFNETSLIRKWQSDYLQEKQKEREERQEKRGKTKNKEETTKKSHNFVKGAILHMAGFKDEMKREIIKEHIIEIGKKEPAFITFDMGDTEGYIRFSEENGAVEFLKNLTDSKMTINETEITCRALEGEEEEKFLDELSTTLSKIKQSQKNYGKGRKRKGGRDGGSRNKHSRN